MTTIIAIIFAIFMWIAGYNIHSKKRLKAIIELSILGISTVITGMFVDEYITKYIFLLVIAICFVLMTLNSIMFKIIKNNPYLQF